MKIIKIKKIGKKYKIELENGLFINTYADIIIKYNILYHKEIDINMQNKIENENIYYDAYYSTISYITKKLRSEYEVKKYLDKYLISIEEKEHILNELKSINLINDKELSKAFVNDKLAFTNNGPYKIKKELEDLKIDADIINDTLDSIDQNIYYEKINKILEKKLKCSQKYSGNVLKQKLANELQNQGYPNEIIYEILNNTTINSDISKEYNKLYNKLKTKYEGIELKKLIKQKLYEKGYTKSEIDKIFDFEY